MIPEYETGPSRAAPAHFPYDHPTLAEVRANSGMAWAAEAEVLVGLWMGGVNQPPC